MRKHTRSVLRQFCNGRPRISCARVLLFFLGDVCTSTASAA